MEKENKIKYIFDKVGCDYNYIKTHPNENLLSRDIGLLARDLLVIYFLLTKEFGVRIPEELVLSGEFATFRVISDIIYNL